MAAVRRQEELSRDMDAQRVARMEERRKAREAEEVAAERMLTSLDARVKQLVEREQAMLRQQREGSTAEAREGLRLRREQIQQAAASFDVVSVGSWRPFLMSMVCVPKSFCVDLAKTAPSMSETLDLGGP